MPITLSELHPAAPACKIYQQYTCRKRSRDHVETALGKPEDRLVSVHEVNRIYFTFLLIYQSRIVALDFALITSALRHFLSREKSPAKKQWIYF